MVSQSQTEKELILLNEYLKDGIPIDKIRETLGITLPINPFRDKKRINRINKFIAEWEKNQK